MSAIDHAAADGAKVRRARIEEIRPLAEAYAREAAAEAPDGQPYDPPIPQGGIFWIAEEADGSAIGYAAGTLRPTGCVVGPVFITTAARRRGVGEALILAVQDWAGNTRVPVVEISVAADNASRTATRSR